jgi:cation transport regulator ChaC
MGRLAVFAYGSLVSPDSFASTLGRTAESVPARLLGWRRRWSLLRDNLASEKTFARRDGGELPRWVIGLNLERDASAGLESAPNGALIEVSGGELERLDVRELRYDRVEVTAEVESGRRFDRVFAYTARPEHFAAEPPPGAVAMATYLRQIEAAFTALGDGQWEQFMSTTGPPPVETIEPVLVRDQIPPGNPRAW